MESYRVITDADANRLNAALLAQYLAHEHNDAVQRSHHINGRYENIYYTETQAPDLVQLQQRILVHAAAMLGQEAGALRTTPWFNAMPPGSVTTWHTHEEDDELLSGVYYIDVPDDSGDLLLRIDGTETRVTPAAGEFILFAPALPHAVSENRSERMRLSVGFNVGLVANEAN